MDGAKEGQADGHRKQQRKTSKFGKGKTFEEGGLYRGGTNPSARSRIYPCAEKIRGASVGIIV